MSRPLVWTNVATGEQSAELVGCTDERRRHRCEVQYVADMTNDSRRATYLAGVRKKRSDKEYERLRADAWRVLHGRPTFDEMEDGNR